MISCLCVSIILCSERRSTQRYSQRQTLFFTAITKFAIKNSVGEVERYYANKARQAPHVISCYTAGARLIGLNERQLEQEIRRMRKAAKKSNSPYAKPLPFVTLTSRKKKKPAGNSGKSQAAKGSHSAHRETTDDVTHGSDVSRISAGMTPEVITVPACDCDVESSEDLYDDHFQAGGFQRDRRPAVIVDDTLLVSLLLLFSILAKEMVFFF